MSDRPTAERQGAPPSFPGPFSAVEELREAVHRGIGAALAPLARLAGRAGISPNQVSVAGALLTAVAAALIVEGQGVAGGAVFLLAGLFDLFDGLLARACGRATAFGAFLDSTLDRVSEGVVFAAIAYVFAAAGQPLAAGGVVLALLFSQLVSYVRARAEGLGLDCKVGLVTRAERVILLAAGLMAGFAAEAMWLIAAASAFTAAQRVAHVGRRLDLEG